MPNQALKQYLIEQARSRRDLASAAKEAKRVAYEESLAQNEIYGTMASEARELERALHILFPGWNGPCQNE